MKARRLALVGVVLAVCVFAAAAQGSHAKSGGTFRLGTSSRIDSLNPFVAFNQDAYSTFEYIYPELIQYDKANHNFAPDFATLVEGVERRQDVDVQDAQRRRLVGRPAAHRRRRSVDDQHRRQVQGRRDGQLCGPDRAHHARRGAESDDARRPLCGGSRQRPRPVPAVPDPAEAHLVSAHRPQGQRPEVVREQSAGCRRRAVQPDQVPEGPDRALPAQRQVLRPEAAGRRVRPADVLERRRARRCAEAPRHRRDRGRARDRDQDACAAPASRSSRCRASTTPTSSSTRTRRRRSIASCSTRSVKTAMDYAIDRAQIVRVVFLGAAHARQLDHPAVVGRLVQPGRQADAVQPREGEPDPRLARLQEGLGRDPRRERLEDVVRR